jgi:hypothetical protein
MLRLVFGPSIKALLVSLASLVPLLLATTPVVLLELRFGRIIAL